MKRIRRGAAVCRWIGEAIDELQLLDDRSGPSVIDDERQGVVMRRADVDEVDVESIDLRDELGQRVERGLDRAPVVLRLPEAGELLHGREGHALRFIRDGLLLGPLRGRDAPTEVLQRRIRNVDGEGADVSGGFDGVRHDDLPGRVGSPSRTRAGASGVRGYAIELPMDVESSAQVRPAVQRRRGGSSSNRVSGCPVGTRKRENLGLGSRLVGLCFRHAKACIKLRAYP